MRRRDLLLLAGASVAADCLGTGRATNTSAAWSAQWIWYPGQLAAYRHSRRVRLAMTRCSYVGYPANFRQPGTEAYFRKSGTASRDVTLRWSAPVARVRTLLGGRGGDVTSRSGLLRSGEQGIEVQIDFAQSLPCLLLEGGEFSTGPEWEASLDGEHWVLAETGAGGDPLHLPDAEREITVHLPVDRTVQPEGAAQETYSVNAGHDIVLDFRETELGVLRFEARGDGELRVQVGESVAEVLDPDVRNFEQYPIEPLQLAVQSSPRALPERALRFARFSSSGHAEVTKLQFDARLWPVEEKGRFECSDQDLNVIWKTAVATLRSNMHDFYLDGIRRDGLLWHDGPLTLDAYERVFFNADLSRQTLIAETMPEHPSIRDVGIIDSPMYDVIGFEREFLVRGEIAFSRMFRERIEDILRFYLLLQNERGFVDAARVQPYGFFPDWSTTSQGGPDGHGTPCYGQMLLSATFSAAARLARAWNDEARSKELQMAAIKLRASIREAFWMPEKGLYANGLDRNGKLDTRTTSFAQAFAISCGIAQRDEYDGLFRFLNDETKRSAHYSLSQVVEFAAYAEGGRAHESLARLKSAWLPMIQRGYRRFFEDIQPAQPAAAQLGMYGRKYAASLCHAWAGAAPIMAFSRGVLGVEPTEAGCRTIALTPQHCGLDWVRGAVPAPGGLIEVEWQGFKGEAVLPEGVHAALADGRMLKGPGRFSFAISNGPQRSRK